MMSTIQVLLYSMISMAIPTSILVLTTTVFKEGILSVNVTRGDGLTANTTDEFHLATLNTSLCNNNAKLKIELSADCIMQSMLGWCDLSCRCSLEGKSSFIVNEKQCADDRKFRGGCYFVFGSWTWATGWTWGTEKDPLETFYAGNGFGFASGLNASTRTFSDCVKTSTTLYNAAGEWEPVAVEPSVTFFKLHGMWHLSWISTGEIEGKFLKLDITCKNENSVNGSAQSVEHSSCVVVKATGYLEHQYNITTIWTNSSPTEQTSSPTVLTRISTIHTSPTGQTNSATIQANGPTVQTSSLTNLTTKGNYTEKPQIGLIVAAVVGSSALILILIAAIVFVASYFKSVNTRNARMARNIPMRCHRGSVNPEAV